MELVAEGERAILPPGNGPEGGAGRTIDGEIDGGDYNGAMHEVVVYSRKGCHLCETVKETLKQVQREADFGWREVDIDGDPELRRKFTEEVPVVFIDGRKAFKYHMERRQFLRVLAGRAQAD